MSEWQWAQAWEQQQQVVDGLPGGRGTWLPNIVEPRRWGALRWTSGRPAHAASTGQAVPESFAVLRPGLSDPDTRTAVVDGLTDRPALTRIVGFGIGEHQLARATIGALSGGLVFAAIAAVGGAGWLVVLVLAAVGAVGGGVAGRTFADYQRSSSRAQVLGDSRQVRVITGRFAPPAWTRLVRATTLLEELAAAGADPDADEQAHEAVQGALWEAAGLLLGSSDHTGVEVLAEGVERLADLRRR
ncbi:MAG: hypothetical protein ACRDWI_03305 [Jiangellaceae bacterium]